MPSNPLCTKKLERLPTNRAFDRNLASCIPKSGSSAAASSAPFSGAVLIWTAGALLRRFRMIPFQKPVRFKMIPFAKPAPFSEPRIRESRLSLLISELGTLSRYHDTASVPSAKFDPLVR